MQSNPDSMQPLKDGQQIDQQVQHHFVHIETPKTSGAKYLHDAPKFTLEWKNLSLKVNVKNEKTKDMQEKVILNDVNGYAKPGELLVIMGPSGAGKSSLLDCISGRNKDIEGSITVNGQPWSKKMKRLASYVMQDDLFYQTITVREHLVFQARLRMGATFTEEQYLDRVDTVMEELGLMKCRDTLIGGPTLRGISGGERKRLSFAAEILTNPSILFVDEPTSGLDSFMAETVVAQLQQIARDGRTVIATIHQPSSELFALFDQLYLLSDGATVYHGKGSESVQYFASLGYQCPPYLNPTDYFMRQLVVMDKATDEAGVVRVEGLKEAWRSRRHEITESNVDSASFEVVFNDGDGNYEDSRLRMLGQIGVLTRRNTTSFLRDKVGFGAAFGSTVFISLVVGLIYLQLDLNQNGIQNFAGAFFFIVVNQTFSSANPTFISVPMELPIVIREYRAGLCHHISWYFSKNLSELPMQILLPIVFFVPVYFLVGIGHGFNVYFQMQLIMILVNCCAVGIGYMVSCLCRRVDLAPVIGVVVILPLLIFGGLFLNSDDVPVCFVWIQYISPIKYGFEAMMKIYWKEIASIPCNEAIENCVALNGTQVLQNYSMSSGSTFGDAMLLLALNVAFRSIGFLG
ncbi:Atp-binding protein, partial [Globisporangium splendens]